MDPGLYRIYILEISTAPTKAKSRKPAYSQALIQNKIDGQRYIHGRKRWCHSKSTEKERQLGNQYANFPSKPKLTVYHSKFECSAKC